MPKLCQYGQVMGQNAALFTTGIINLPRHNNVGSIYGHGWSPAKVEEELIFSENKEVVAPSWALHTE